jgi:hypothetical protein
MTREDRAGEDVQGIERRGSSFYTDRIDHPRDPQERGMPINFKAAMSSTPSASSRSCSLPTRLGPASHGPGRGEGVRNAVNDDL